MQLSTWDRQPGLLCIWNTWFERKKLPFVIPHMAGRRRELTSQCFTRQEVAEICMRSACPAGKSPRGSPQSHRGRRGSAFPGGTSLAADILTWGNTQGEVQLLVGELISSATCAIYKGFPQGAHHPSASQGCGPRTYHRPARIASKKTEVGEKPPSPRAPCRRCDRWAAEGLQTPRSSALNSAAAVSGKLRREVLLIQASEGISISDGLKYISLCSLYLRKCLLWTNARFNEAG